MMFELFESGDQTRLLTALLRDAQFAASNIQFVKPEILFDEETDKQIADAFVMYFEYFDETPVKQDLLLFFANDDELEAIDVRLDEIYEAEFNSEGLGFLEQHLQEFITRPVLDSVLETAKIDLENGVRPRLVEEEILARLNETRKVIPKTMSLHDMKVLTTLKGIKDFDKWWANRVRRLERKNPDHH